MSRNITLRQLRILNAVVTTGSITAAAEHINLTQPAVSKSIASLEEEIGFKVFERYRNSLILTEIGAQMYRETERLLSVVEDFGSIVEDMKIHGARSLRLVTTQVIGVSAFLSEALNEFTNQHPNVQIQLDVRPRHELQQSVAANQADIGLGIMPFNHPGITTKKLGTSPVIAVVAKRNPLARSKSISARSLADVPLLVTRETSRLRKMIDHQFYEAGVKPLIRAEVSNSVVSCQMAAAGLGVAICDAQSVRSSRMRNISVLPWSKNLELEYGFVTREAGSYSDYLDHLETLIRRRYKIKEHETNQ